MYLCFLTKKIKMRRGVKIALIIGAVGGLGYLAYRYFYGSKKPADAGTSTDEDLVYDKANRVIQINKM